MTLYIICSCISQVGNLLIIIKAQIEDQDYLPITIISIALISPISISFKANRRHHMFCGASLEKCSIVKQTQGAFTRSSITDKLMYLTNEMFEIYLLIKHFKNG